MCQVTAGAVALWLLPNSPASTLQDFYDYIEAQYNNGTPVMLEYELATPVPFTFTPIENINTLYGVNNIFQDAGDTTATYKADIGLYIDKKTA